MSAEWGAELDQIWSNGVLAADAMQRALGGARQQLESATLHCILPLRRDGAVEAAVPWLLAFHVSRYVRRPLVAAPRAVAGRGGGRSEGRTTSPTTFTLAGALNRAGMHGSAMLVAVHVALGAGAVPSASTCFFLRWVRLLIPPPPPRRPPSSLLGVGRCSCARRGAQRRCVPNAIFCSQRPRGWHAVPTPSGARAAALVRGAYDAPWRTAPAWVLERAATACWLPAAGSADGDALNRAAGPRARARVPDSRTVWLWLFLCVCVPSY